MLHGIRSSRFHSTAFFSITLSTVNTLFTILGARSLTHSRKRSRSTTQSGEFSTVVENANLANQFGGEVDVSESLDWGRETLRGAGRHIANSGSAVSAAPPSE